VSLNELFQMSPWPEP